MILPNYFYGVCKRGEGEGGVYLLTYADALHVMRCLSVIKLVAKGGRGGRGAVGDFRNPSSHIVELPLFHHPLLCIGGGRGGARPLRQGAKLSQFDMNT